MAAQRFCDVDTEILEQHGEIRARLQGLRAHAERSTLPWAAPGLRSALLRFAARFEEHLAFEERELEPRMRVLDAWGPARADALLAEHRDQRRCLERICALAEDPSAAGDRLADEVSAFVVALLADMLEEEGKILDLVRREQAAPAEQMTG